jgi:hypothetical protein
VLGFKGRGFNPSEADVRLQLDRYLAVAGRDAIDWHAIGRAATDLDRALKPFGAEFPVSPHKPDEVGRVPLRDAIPLSEFRCLLEFWKRLAEPKMRGDPARSLAAFFAAELYTRPPPAKWPHHEAIACLFYEAFVGDVSPKLCLEQECKRIRSLRDPRQRPSEPGHLRLLKNPD